MEKMRTRFLPKMTHDEVCEYVKRNDIIYVPFGTVEVHGTFPLDVETTTPEAFALLMAEETDGLVLGNLPYFFCGASPISPGTITSQPWETRKSSRWLLAREEYFT